MQQALHTQPHRAQRHRRETRQKDGEDTISCLPALPASRHAPPPHNHTHLEGGAHLIRINGSGAICIHQLKALLQLLALLVRQLWAQRLRGVTHTQQSMAEQVDAGGQPVAPGVSRSPSVGVRVAGPCVCV